MDGLQVVMAMVLQRGAAQVAIATICQTLGVSAADGNTERFVEVSQRLQALVIQYLAVSSHHLALSWHSRETVFSPAVFLHRARSEALCTASILSLTKGLKLN